MDYRQLAQQIDGLTKVVTDPVANMANTSALLFEQMPHVNWAGFYVIQKGELILGPFQGKTACIRIALGKGVCGTAAVEDRVLRVEDVHAFPGHIACDSMSNAEIVLPIHASGKVVAVLDIDSPNLNRFSQEDEVGLTEIVSILEKNCDWTSYC